MAISKKTMQESLSFKIINAVSASCGVASKDVQSPVKRRDITRAKRVCSNIMCRKGYTNAEISRALNIDPKAVHNYIISHEIHLRDESYSNSYISASKSVEYYTDNNKEVSEQLSDVMLRLISLESKYEHLKNLITN